MCRIADDIGHTLILGKVAAVTCRVRCPEELSEVEEAKVAGNGCPVEGLPLVGSDRLEISSTHMETR